ncbi:MAG: hypothetical protein AB7N24_14585 [Dehalococcoidia bacterium]
MPTEPFESNALRRGPERTEEERLARRARVRARLAAHELHAAHDSTELTRPAREAFAKGFAERVDPNGELEPGERIRRAAHAKKAYFTRLGMLSGKARRKEAN